MFVPWKPSYSRNEAASALAASETWAGALRRLGVAPLGKSFAVLRKWADRWGIDSSHLAPYKARKPAPAFTEAELRTAVEASRSFAETLRRLGYCPTGGNPRTVRKWAERWAISIEHFDPRAAQREAMAHRGRSLPLAQILIEHSTYPRGSLKRRLFDAGIKRPSCELCGQGDVWRDRPMGMILDHINGVRDDNRIENLRIVCPNCAATLDTHCGRRHPMRLGKRECLRCGNEFRPNRGTQRYCSQECGSKWDRSTRHPIGARRVERPPHEQLMREIEETSYLAVGRKYGVSDNAVRKWVRWYERDRELSESANDLGDGAGPGAGGSAEPRVDESPGE